MLWPSKKPPAPLVEPAINTVVYFLHEKFWQRKTGAAPAPVLSA